MSPYNASWERNRDLVVAAEKLGYDSTLIAQHTTNPHIEDFDHGPRYPSPEATANADLANRLGGFAKPKWSRRVEPR
jgi:alkanesulfonate monooxygenase